MYKANYDLNDITKLATADEARMRYRVSRQTLMKIATEAGAVRRFGKAVRIDVTVLDKFIDDGAEC